MARQPTKRQLRAERDRARADARSWSYLAHQAREQQGIPQRVRGQLATVARRIDPRGYPLVYVAAASERSQLERAERLAAALTAAGCEVVSSWMRNIREVGAANPAQASRDQRAALASVCLAEVLSSDIVIALVPPRDVSTSGAWWEAGVAHWTGRTLIAVGETSRSIFLGLADHEVDADEAALALCVEERARMLPLVGLLSTPAGMP